MGWVVVVALLCGGPLMLAQNPEGPGLQGPAVQPQGSPGQTSVLQVNTRIVPLDIVVTDSKGRPVHGLGRDAFSVTENGVPQKLKYFEEHSAAQAKKTELPPLPPGEYTNFPTATVTDSVTVLLVDVLNTRLEDQMYVRQQILDFLKTMPVGNRVAIFTLASKLRLLQAFTADPEVLKAVVKDKKFLQRPAGFTMGEAAGPDAASAPDVTDPMVATSEDFAGFEADMAAVQNEQRLYITTDALMDLGQYLVSIPGRKNLVWFAGNFPLGLAAGPTGDDPFSAMSEQAIERRRLTDLYIRAQIAVYPVSARGLSVDVPGMSAASSSGRGMSGGAMTSAAIAHSNAVANERIPMLALAEQTGGKAFFDSNALDKAIGTALEDGNNFYTVTYTPTDPSYDQTFRKINVTVAGGKYKLAYRHGYYADEPNGPKNAILNAGTEPPAQQQEANFFHAMTRGVPASTDILFKVHMAPIAVTAEEAAKPVGDGAAKLKPPVTRYAFDYAISMRALAITKTADGEHHVGLLIGAVAYDAEGNPLNSTTQDMTIDMKPAIYADFIKTGLKYSQEIDLPETPVYVRLGVYDKASKRVGAMEIPLKPVAAKGKE
jgi:VWFA-related protein